MTILTGCIEINIILVMSFSGNDKKVKEQPDKELSRISEIFGALSIHHKKGILKTSRGLLRIQKTSREMVGEGAGHSILTGQFT